MTRAALPAIVILCLALATGAQAEESAGDTAAKDGRKQGHGFTLVSPPTDLQDFSQGVTVDTSLMEPPAEGRKRGEFIGAPIPISDPSIGTGLGVVAGYLFRLRPSDTVSPSSLVGIGGFKTDNGSWAAGLGAKLYLAEDRYRVTFGVGQVDVQYDFHGVGSGADQDTYVPLALEGNAYTAECLRKVGHGFHLGGRYLVLDLTTGLDLSDVTDPEDWELPGLELRSRSAALGLHAQRDTRDSSFYPRKGSLLDLTADVFDDTWGSDLDFQVYAAAFNQYRRLGERGVLAWRASARTAQGDRIPLYLLSSYGSHSDLRGYGIGQYQDRTLAAVQVEVRRELWKRLGMVAFAGIGGVGEDISDIGGGNLLPSAGVGLRFLAAKRSHVNVRIDYAVGEDGGALHIGVGEAF